MDEPSEAPPNAIRMQKHYDVTWLDVENPNPEVFEQLKNDYQLHEVHLKESIQKVQHTQIEREENYLFFVLHTPIYNQQINKIIITQIGVFLGKDYVITIRSAKSPAVTALYEHCAEHPEQTKDYFAQGASYLLYAIVNEVLIDISLMTDAVDNELDAIEDSVFDNDGSDALIISRVRQKIVKLRRVIGPKRLVLQDLADQMTSFAGDANTKYYSNNVKTVAKMWEGIEEAKETIEIYKDADFTTSTEQTNRTLAVLTLIFTFTIPVTVLGTMYGMNVPLPGGNEAGSWTFLGPYTTVLMIFSFSALTAIGMFMYFRSKRWI